MRNQESRISFIIPAFNAERVVSEAVRSILNKNFKEGDEIILVDDGSQDRTWDVIKALSNSTARVYALRHRFNKGSAGAGRNTGIDAANNDLIFCLDADNILEPGTIAKLLQHHCATGADATAFGEVWFFTEPFRMTHKWRYLPEVKLADALHSHLWPGPDGNYLFTRESWMRAGRYDESVGGAIDSWAFGIAQLATGARIVTLPQTGYWHCWGHDSAFIRGQRSGGLSLKATRVLLNHLNVLDSQSVEYILCSEARDRWFFELDKHPLLVRSGEGGEGGALEWRDPPQRSFLTRLRQAIARKLEPT